MGEAAAFEPEHRQVLAMTSHKRNVYAIFAGLLIGLTLFMFGCWQLDLLSAPYVWSDRQWREVLPFWHMWSTEAYVMFFTWIVAGLAVAVVTVFASLWFWDD